MIFFAIKLRMTMTAPDTDQSYQIPYSMPYEMDEYEAALPVKPKDILAILDKLSIAYTTYEHEPVFTVEQGRHLHEIIAGGHCKNLFLKDKKDQRWLISAIEETKIDLKRAQDLMGSGRLSFASPTRLWDSLKVRSGSVTPFALINDKDDHAVNVVLDKTLFDHDQINFHPLINNQSTALSPQDLLKFIEYCGHTPQIIDFSGLDY